MIRSRLDVGIAEVAALALELPLRLELAIVKFELAELLGCVVAAVFVVERLPLGVDEMELGIVVGTVVTGAVDPDGVLEGETDGELDGVLEGEVSVLEGVVVGLAVVGSEVDGVVVIEVAVVLLLLLFTAATARAGNSKKADARILSD